MDYRQQLQKEKELREHAEKDAQRLKNIQININNLHSLYDGEFLTYMEEVLINYQKNKT